MNNLNPFVPQGSVLEQNKRRSRMKLAVSLVLIVSVGGLGAMLFQGCKRGQTTENLPPVEPTNNFATDTNLSPTMVSTGAPPTMVSNSAPPAAYVPPVVAPVVPEATGSEYTIVKGDTLAKIAKNNHVSVKALEAANPNVQPTKLKVGQKLAIPAGAIPAPAAVGTSAGTEAGTVLTGGGETYTIKSGDTLTKIAKSHGTTVKAIETENHLSTTKIKVGQKLKLPAKAAAAAPAAAPVAAPAPAVAPVTPAPAGTPTGR